MEKPDTYYAESLNASALYQVYQTKIDRVRQYLDQEIQFVRSQLRPEDQVLELGAGYGRVMKRLSPFVKAMDGIDSSARSVAFGQDYLKPCANCRLSVADAYQYESQAGYDAVLCLQNGLSAFHGDADLLVTRSLRLLKAGGRAFFSSYSAKFWEHRLAWFQEQADKGLLGEIDHEKTGDGVIVCKDGFQATTFSPDSLDRLGKASGRPYTVQEVDESSVFLILTKE